MHYSLTRATLWNIAGYLYLIVSSFIATPVLIKYLGIEIFAQYGLIVATVTLVSAINLGLPQAVTRALARDYLFSPRRQTLWATSSILFITTGLAAGSIAVFVSHLFHVPSDALPYIFCLALINNLVAHYTTLPQAEGHFGYYNTKTFIVGSGNTLLAAYLSSLGQGIISILVGQLVCYFVSLFVLAYFSLKFFPHPRKGVPSKIIAYKLINFGIKNQIGTIIGQVEGQYSKYLLAGLSPILFSAFVIAQGLVYKVAGGIAQVASALYPALARSTQSSIRPLYYRLQVTLFLAGLFGAFLYHLIGYDFLSWWLHSLELVNLVDSIMTTFVWYLALLLLTPLASTVLDSRGHPELTSLLALSTTVIEIVVAMILFPVYGLMAPVYGALAGALIMTIPLLLTVDRVFKQSI